MNRPSEAFYDDSSSALSLGHNVSTGALSAPRRLSSGGIERHFEPQVAEHNRIVRDRIEKRARELVAEGHEWKRARELATEEIENPKITRPIEDQEDRERRKWENLMNDKHVDGGGSSGSKSKFKSRKTGTAVCPNCHLEGCCYRGPGRPFQDGRSARVKANVRHGVKERLLREGVTAGRVVQAVVDLAESIGVNLETVTSVLEATKADPEGVSELFKRSALQISSDEVNCA